MSLPPFSSFSSPPILSMYKVADTTISIPLGIIIGLLASFVQSLGLTIQRKSHVLNQQLPEAQQRVEHRRPLWLLGFGIFISSNILGSLVQIASLPVVILAPLGAVSLLWNAFFAKVLLGDVFSPWMVLGTVLIAGGAVLIAVFGIVPEPTRSLEDLLALFRRPTFVAYFSLLGAVVFVCLLITHVVEYSFLKKIKEDAAVTASPASPASLTLTFPENPSTLTTGVTELTATERTPLLAHDKTAASSSQSLLLSPSKPEEDETLRKVNRTRLLLAISYASFSGIISGMCLLFAKSGVELLVLTLRGQNQFWRWQSWVLVLGLAVFALLQLWYLHKALILANPTLVCPSAFCFYNLSSIVNGLVYFDQFSLIPPLHLALVVLGIFVLLGGVWVVSIQSGDGITDNEEWSDEESLGSETDVPQEEPTKAAESPRSNVIKQLSDYEDDDEHIPVAEMDRLAKSDSQLYGLSTSPDTMTPLQALGLGRPPLRGPSASRQQHISLADSTSSGSHARSHPTSPLSLRHASASETLPLSPTTRARHRRRPTLDTSDDRFRSLPYGLLTHGHSHGHANPVSTLGGGFQIGLSPMSPGFSILPRDRHSRGRRVSGLGVSSGSGSGSGSGYGTVGGTLGERRRRTVSEGDVRRALGDHTRETSAEVGGDDVDGRGDGDVEAQVLPGTARVPVDKGKGKADGRTRPVQARWTWLRSVFLSKK
ncbi:hypothetical protein HGRIS_007921 [Hohenbuehelia grisea]|uniref:Magnesium transporter n=1 Tax=Hohenbuehelia grisea TaxID=104357 RepID=A0ABR3J6S4_9AGAR